MPVLVIKLLIRKYSYIVKQVIKRLKPNEESINFLVYEKSSPVPMITKIESNTFIEIGAMDIYKSVS